MPKLIRQSPGGYVQINDDGKIIEMGASTCQHCGHITLIPPGSKAEDVGIGLCHACFGLVCKGCLGKGCAPIEKWCEEMEHRHMFRKALDEG